MNLLGLECRMYALSFFGGVGLLPKKKGTLRRMGWGVCEWSIDMRTDNVDLEE